MTQCLMPPETNIIKAALNASTIGIQGIMMDYKESFEIGAKLIDDIDSTLVDIDSKACAL